MLNRSTFGQLAKKLTATLAAIALVTLTVPNASQPALALPATLTVTTLADVEDANDRVLSLREAITDAVSGDAIDFSATLFTSGPQVMYPLAPFTISKVLEIRGPGKDLLTLRGPRVNSTMVSYSRTSGIVTVVLSATPEFVTGNMVFFYDSDSFLIGAYGVTSISGKTFTVAVAGIDIASTTANATIASTTQLPGNAWNAEQRAFLVPSTLTLKNLTLDKFFAERGGAIDVRANNAGNLVIDGVRFSNNVAYGYYCGGAISTGSGQTAITNSDFSENIARCGSAINIGDQALTLSIDGSTFTNNISYAGTLNTNMPTTFNNSTMSGSRNLQNGEVIGIEAVSGQSIPFTMIGSTVSDKVSLHLGSKAKFSGSTLTELFLAAALATFTNNNIEDCAVSSLAAIEVATGNTFGSDTNCGTVTSTGGGKIATYSRTTNVAQVTTATNHGISTGNTVRMCWIQALASHCGTSFSATAVDATTVSFASVGSDFGSTASFSDASGRAAYIYTKGPVVLVAQTVSWAPIVASTADSSPKTPSAKATTKGDGAITYSVVDAGGSGCSAHATTAVLTFTSSGYCTVRATAATTTNWAEGTKTVIFEIGVAPSVTSTVPVSTTTTVVNPTPVASTTVPGITSTTTTSPTATTTPSSATAVSPSTTTLPTGQSAVATIAPSTRAVTPVASPMILETPQTTVATSQNTLSPQATSTTIFVPAPDAPEIKPGAAGLVVNGKSVTATVTRTNNQLITTGGGISLIVSGLLPNGERIELDANGNLRLEEDAKIVIESTGYEAEQNVEVWMFSTPSLLGKLSATATGAISGTFDIPTDLESGDHRLVLKGINNDGEDVVLGVGMMFGSVDSGTSVASRMLIGVPVALAVLIGLFIPAVSRRRRKQSLAI